MTRGIIIGMGKIAQTGHLPAYQLLSPRRFVEIPAAVETDSRSRELAHVLYPHLKFYDTLEECLRAEQPDFVDICTPPQTHAGFIEAALAHPVHILCEKPFAPDAEAARVLVDRLRSTQQRVFMTCHQYKYSPVWKQFYEFRRTFTSADRFYLQFDVYRTEADPGVNAERHLWRTDSRVSGGGILADTGIHYLNLCYWLFGVPLSVTARTASLRYTDTTVEDTACVFLEYPAGIVVINCTWAADRRTNSARFTTHRNSLRYDGSTLLRYTDGTSDHLPVPDASDKQTYVAQYAGLFDDFARQMEQRSRRDDWIVEAYDTVRLLSACYASAAGGHTIHIAD